MDGPRKKPKIAPNPPQEASQPDSRPNAGLTFRVRGVPSGWGHGELKSFLAERDESASPTVWSLADEIHGLSRTATVSFQNLPSQLQKAGDSWKIPLPAAPNQPSRPQSLTLEGGFLGITTLYAPPSQDHKIE